MTIYSLLPPRPILLVAACILMLQSAAARQVPDSGAADVALEEYLDDIADAETGIELTERLIDLTRHPLDVNRASAVDLARVPPLGPLLARRVVLFRKHRGAFMSLDELASVPGVTQATVHRLRPFLVVRSRTPSTGRTTNQRPRPSVDGELLQRIDRRLDLGRGFVERRFLGGPFRLYSRLRLQIGRRATAALTLEKDPGEPFRWDPESGTYGYDFVGGHAAISDRGMLKTLIVGDYTASFGQGLILWRRGAFGGSRYPLRAVTRSSSGLRPSFSRSEYGFFRGAAVTVSPVPRLAVHVFASRRLLDASIMTDSLRTSAQLSTTGYHRTATEMGRKGGLREVLLGSGVELDRGRSSLGVTAYASRFSRRLFLAPRPDSYFDRPGPTFFMMSAHGRVYWSDLHLFAELATDRLQHWAQLAGLTYRPTRSVGVAALVRHYPPPYQSLHGYGFGNTSSTQNETGLYLGLQVRPHRQWQVNASIDQFWFPWLRFSVPRPSTGYEADLSAAFAPRPWLDVEIGLRARMKEVGRSIPIRAGGALAGLGTTLRRIVRLQTTFRFSPNLRLRSRLEHAWFAAGHLPDERGSALYQDLRFRPYEWLRLDLRLTLFDTDGYNSRIYFYENDLLYAFSVPALSGQGQRSYVLVQLKPLRQLALEVKTSVSQWEHRSDTGTGLHRRPGNRLRSLRGQVRWVF